jgi:hypothetical protein
MDWAKLSVRANILSLAIAAGMAGVELSNTMKKSACLAPCGASRLADSWPRRLAAVCILVAAALDFMAVRVARRVAVYIAVAAAARAIEEDSSEPRGGDA